MATVWAKQNGNWTDTTLWAFWNEATQQIEDYGQIPQNGDTVYCNSYRITINTDVNIGTGNLRNDTNPHTNMYGGDLYITTSRNIVANLYAYTELIHIQLNNSINIFITGNVYGDESAHNIIYRSSNDNIYLRIVGNVESNSSYFILNYSTAVYYFKCEIIGNFILNSNYSNRNEKNTASSLKITGIFSVHLNLLIKDININGLILSYYSNIISDLLTINGQIKYLSNTNNPGVTTEALTILNPDTFTWKDITEPRVNPFIILTDAEMNNRQQYPPEDEVKEGTEYVWGEKVGTYLPNYPPESVVLKDYEYGDSDDRKTGTMVQEVNVEVGCVTPEDVRKDVPLVGMGVVGSLVVPSVDDVREGVVFDNGSVGTLIVQGGGDRLRIADFGYYTNAQSDTYIVDLTEQDKPKFAVAEERVLIEMFPDLDLENIPDKYFDDLFVKYLKYRLIVEYYRTAGINSTFTPSEPTTEIVNYQNVRNEVWLNSANIYLKAWGEKYPNSIKKQRTLL